MTAWNSLEGRGAWTTRGKDNGRTTYAFVLGRRRDGARPTVDEWHQCVFRGVQAIKMLLDFHGHTEHSSASDTPHGIYGRKCKRMVKEFQREHNLNADGVTGSLTVRKMMESVIITAAADRHIAPSLLYGISSAESGLDPGAQGFDHPPDKGLWQDNTDYISELEAFDPIGAAHRHAARIKAAWNKYDGKGKPLQLDCSIAQHNAPAWADQWYENGEPPNDQIAEYVARVKVRIEAW